MDTKQTSAVSIKDMQLLKHFSLVLRNKANGKEADLLDAPALRHLSRKDLIEIITSPHFVKSKSIKDIDLLKMENEELLEVIGNQMLILSHLIPQWIEEPKAKTIPVSGSNQKPKPEKTTPNANKKNENGKKA